MRTLRTIIAELVGLVVDDGRFAGAIVIWLAIVGLGLSRLQNLHPWIGVILFAGLALILIENTLRQTHK